MRTPDACLIPVLPGAALLIDHDSLRLPMHGELVYGYSPVGGHLNLRVICHDNVTAILGAPDVVAGVSGTVLRSAADDSGQFALLVIHGAGELVETQPTQRTLVGTPPRAVVATILLATSLVSVRPYSDIPDAPDPTKMNFPLSAVISRIAKASLHPNPMQQWDEVDRLLVRIAAECPSDPLGGTLVPAPPSFGGEGQVEGRCGPGGRGVGGAAPDHRAPS